MVVRCPDCRFEAKSEGTLRAHQRLAHGIDKGANRRAAEKTLAVLRGLGRLEDIDAATVQTIRGLADALDSDSTNANLWKVYRDALKDLMRVDDDADDELAKALAEIRSAGPLGNPAPSGA